jgi:hypothetical protein
MAASLVKWVGVLAIAHFGDNGSEPQRIRRPLIHLLVQYHFDVLYIRLAKYAADAMKAKSRVKGLRMALCM